MMALAALVGTTPAFALHDATETTREIRREVSNTLENEIDDTSKKVATTVESTKTITDDAMDQKQQIEDRKAALRAEIEAKKADRKSKLEGRRLAQCQNRQDKINELLGKSVENGQRHIDNIKRFEQQVTAFAKKKALDASVYQEAYADVELKEGVARAAVDLMQAQTFDCSSVDGSKPADILRTTREEKQAAVREYRDSVIVYLQAVKAAFSDTQSQDETKEQE
jgi:hypothetical protein